MSNRTFATLIVVLVAVILIVRMDVLTKVKIGVTNMMYGSEMMALQKFYIVVEPLLPELEREGLTRDSLQQTLSAMLVKAGMTSLTEGEWKNTEGKPVLNVTVYATKTEGDRYQYSVTLDVAKRDTQSAVSYADKFMTIWSSSHMGEGNAADIRARLTREMELFLKAHAGF